MTAPSSDLLLPKGIAGLKLAPGQRVLRSFQPDLDDNQRFAEGLVVLSDLQLHVRGESGGFQSFALTPTLELRRREHGGLSELSCFDQGQRLFRVQYTLAVAAAGSDFVSAFEATRGSPSARPAARDEEPDEEPDEEFVLPETAPTGHPLWRLLSFARPRLGKVAIGLALTLGTTAVGLIPPYLTMPLVDRVLVPWQESHGVALASAHHALVVYLGGLALAAFVAWLLA